MEKMRTKFSNSHRTVPISGCRRTSNSASDVDKRGDVASYRPSDRASPPDVNPSEDLPVLSPAPDSANCNRTSVSARIGRAAK